MKIQSLIFSVIINFLIISCKTEKKEPIQKAVFQIDNEFRPYFANFLKEGKLRKIVIDTTNLIIKAANENSKLTETCGTCTQDLGKPTSQKTIEIYTNSTICWKTTTENAREALVFHELGHCILGRVEHKTDTFTDGTPKSLMYPYNNDLYSPCVYAIDDVSLCNKTERRKYYIDELFNPNTSTPIWAR